MIIKTKYAFMIFSILLVLMFPYFIFFLGINSLSSLVPGWNTNVFGSLIISDLFIFFVLNISVYLYWKLYRKMTEISLKYFIIHFVLTIPLIFFSGTDFFEINTSDQLDPENFIRNFYLASYSLTFIFFVGQIFFWIYYKKITQ